MHADKLHKFMDFWFDNAGSNVLAFVIQQPLPVLTGKELETVKVASNHLWQQLTLKRKYEIYSLFLYKRHTFRNERSLLANLEGNPGDLTFHYATLLRGRNLLSLSRHG